MGTPVFLGCRIYLLVLGVTQRGFAKFEQPDYNRPYQQPLLSLWQWRAGTGARNTPAKVLLIHFRLNW